MSNRKTLTLANKIRNLKKGQSFPLADKKERENACRNIKALRDAGILTLEVITRKSADGRFSVIAL